MNIQNPTNTGTEISAFMEGGRVGEYDLIVVR